MEFRYLFELLFQKPLEYLRSLENLEFVLASHFPTRTLVETLANADIKRKIMLLMQQLKYFFVFPFQVYLLY